MGLSLTNQIIEQIQNNTNYLIILKPQPSIDAITCAFALYELLKKIDKQVIIVSSDFNFPPSLTFLQNSPVIFSDLKSLNKYTLNIDLGKTSLQEIHYEETPSKLQIYLTPKSGALPEQQLSLQSSLPSFDAIITIDVQDLESLGALYADNTDLFYQTPIINIDHVASNEQFGQINLVELTCTSNAEVLYDFMQTHYPNIIDEKIATYLLCGIISKTKSFKNPNITPKSLNIVAQLMAKGAKREEIIASLYQTKSVSTLKLWGRVLARLQQDPIKNWAWSTLTREDFTKSGVNSESQVADVIEEFISHHLSVQIIFLFFESIKGSIRCIIHPSHLENVMTILSSYQPRKNNGYIEIEIARKPIDAVQKEIFDKLSQK